MAKRSIIISEEYGLWKLETDDGFVVTAASPPQLLSKAIHHRGLTEIGAGSLSTAGVILGKLFRNRGIGEEG